jgi:hypothetical protein
MMQWSLERIVPQFILGDNHRLEIIKKYLQQLKKEKLTKVKRG